MNSATKVFCLGLVALVCYFFANVRAQAQSLFEADSASYNIYEFTPGGAQSTFASGVGVAGQLAFNNAGDLFAADSGTGEIYEFTPNGAQSTFASGLNHPNGLALNSAGDLFVADWGNNSIYEFTPSGSQSTFASGLNSPQSLAFDNAGNLFEADSVSGNIYEFTPSGSQSTFASGVNPYRLVFNSAGDLFVGQIYASGSSIIKITPGGVQSPFVSYSRFNITSMVFNSAGDLFTANVPTPENYGYNGSIIKITSAGAQSTFAFPLNSPAGLAFQVPEPSTCSLLILGFVALLGSRRMRRR